MKKLLLFFAISFSGVLAIGQRFDKNISTPGFSPVKKQAGPVVPAITPGTVPDRTLNYYHSPEFDPTWAGRFQTVLDSVRIATGLKGTSLAVLVPGQGLLTCVSGISSPGVPVTTATRFGVMSNTKLFIAVTMAKLQEQGILSLDDHLYQWLPGFPNVDSNTTIRQMLSHQSGIFDYWNDSDSIWNLMLADTSRFWTPQDILATIGTPHFAPGHGFSYSNTNYLLAGMVIEAATGQSWGQKIRDVILNPLAMDSTFIGVFESRNGPVAAEYYGTIPIINSPMTAEFSQGNAAAAIMSTAQEMAGWYHELFSGNVISNASLAQVTDFEPTSFYGLGLAEGIYLNHLNYNHTGGGLGYSSLTWYDVETQATLSMLMNDRNYDFNARLLPLLDVLYKDAPKKQNDAGISGIISPWGNNCSMDRIPSVKLTNFGNAALTTVNIHYSLDQQIPSVYPWTGSLGSGDTITVVLPQVSAGPGHHTFTCFTALPNGVQEGNTYNDTAKSNFITSELPSMVTEIYETFDSNVFPPDGWTANSASIFQWGHTSLASLNGTGSLVKSNYNDGYIGAYYDFELPVIHITGGTHPELSFNYAYAMYPGYFYDSLQVFVSPDCGATWQTLFSKGSLGLYTSPPTYQPFYPYLNDEWKHESFPLAEFTGDLLIRFRDVCGFGNNLYLDDIMVSFPSGFAGNPLPETCRVYPNPASDMISITGLPAGAGIEITDMAGKVLLTRSTLNDPAKIDISSLPKGIYLLRSGLVVKKIVRI